MQIRITGRHVEVSDKVRSYAEEKLGKLLKYYDRISSIELTLESTREQQHAKGIVHVEHNAPMVAEAEKPDVIAAIDAVADELELQIRKHKQMIRDGKKHAGESVRGG